MREPVVRPTAPLEPGYLFVPKGNVYVTANCRRKTQAAGQIVFAVVDSKKKTLGIRVPKAIYSETIISETETRKDRAHAVSKRDHILEKQFRAAILKEFPKVPPNEIPQIVKTAMHKGSGHVGRVGKLELEDKARLAVRAHIRHSHTDYETMFNLGVKKQQAREETIGGVNRIATAWGEQSASDHGKRYLTQRAKREPGAKGNALREEAKALFARVSELKRDRKAQNSLSKNPLESERITLKQLRTMTRKARRLISQAEKMGASETIRATRRTAPRTRSNKTVAKSNPIADHVGNSLNDDGPDESDELSPTPRPSSRRNQTRKKRLGPVIVISDDEDDEFEWPNTEDSGEDDGELDWTP